MYKTISDIGLIYSGKILKRYKIDDHTVKISGIVLEKPFKVSAEAANDALCSVLKKVLV